MTEIDPVQFGRLIQSVETLSEQLERTSTNVVALNSRIAELENRYRIGKSALAGIVFGAGLAGKQVIDIAASIWKSATG